MKKSLMSSVLALTVVCLAAPAWACPTYSCPSGYAPICDPNYVQGQGFGSDIAQNICYEYPYNNDYSRVSFSLTTANNSVALVMGSDTTAGSGDNAGLTCYDGTVTTSHIINCTKVPAGQKMQYAFATCDGSNCGLTDSRWYTYGSSGWSIAGYGGTGVNAYYLTSSGTLPTPTSGTLTDYIYLEGAPNVLAGHMWIAEIGNMWQTGVLPSGTPPSSPYDEYAVEVDGTACNAALAGCTVNNITVQINCESEGSLSVNPLTNDFNTSLNGTQFLCWYPAGGWQAKHNWDEVIFTPATGVTGAHSITITKSDLIDVENQNVVVYTAPPVTYSFTVNAVGSLPYTPPSNYPSISGLSTWTGNIGGSGQEGQPCQGGSGYPYWANCWQYDLQNSPGEYFNDSTSSTLWSAAPWALNFYNVGRFEQQFGDMLATCSSNSPILPCPAWSSGPKTYGEIINNTNCFLDVSVAGTDTTAPPCPAFGGKVTNGSGGPTYISLGTQAQWVQLAQIFGDQYRNNNLLTQQWIVQQEYGLFAIGLEERFFRRSTTGNTDQLDANAISFPLYPFVTVTGNGADNCCNLVGSDIKVPLGTMRAEPLDLIFLDMWWRVNYYITGNPAPPTDAAGVNLIKRWEDVQLNYIYRLISCKPNNAIGVGTGSYPYCGNSNIQITSTNFDMGLVSEALKETCLVENDLGSGCDPALPTAELALLDWQNSQQFQLNALFYPGVYAQPYDGFQVPAVQEPMEQTDIDQAALNNMIAPSFAWLGAWCGNCNLPTSGTPIWTVADEYFSNAWNGVSGPKQYAQLLYGFSNYIHYRTDPVDGGWTGLQSETSPTLNAYESNYPNTLGPYPQMEFPETPVLTPSGAGSFIAEWYSAPAATPYVRYALSPNDPWNAAPQVTGTQSCTDGMSNTMANICLNTVNVTGIPTAGTYNVAFGGTDAAGNTAESEVDWSLIPSGCCFQVVVSEGAGAQAPSISKSSAPPVK